MCYTLYYVKSGLLHAKIRAMGYWLWMRIACDTGEETVPTCPLKDSQDFDRKECAVSKKKKNECI